MHIPHCGKDILRANWLREPRWRRRRQWRGRQIPAALENWLLDTSSLTLRLQHHCTDGFRVQLFEQSWQIPMRNEAIRLGMPTAQKALVRQVHLFCNAQPVVYARTVIPPASLVGKPRRLASLGQRSLGAVLFADKSMRRSDMEICRVTARQRLFQEALYYHRVDVEQPPNWTEIWGRRSVFTLQRKPLLVSEIFLPSIAYT